jgi:dolichol-phosphate mannosyltransferase
MATGVIIPAYNEGEAIVQLVKEIQRFIPDGQVVVVDDSPKTTSVDALSKAKFENLKVIHRSTKGGRGSAVIEGMSYLVSLGCDPIIEMDADFSHPPSQLTELIQMRKDRNLDLLIASRYLKSSQIVNWPLSRRVFSKFSNLLARSVLQIPIQDYTNGYRCYSLAAAKIVSTSCGKIGKGFISLSEILVTLYCGGCRIGETPTRFVNRVRGESSVNHKEIWNAFTGLFHIYGLKQALTRQKNKDLGLETNHETGRETKKAQTT